MKKFVFAFLLIFIFLLACCAPASVLRGGVVIRSDLPKPANIASYYSKETLVYVTKSGTRYHKDGCSFLKSSKIIISLEQALQEGLTPCSRCYKDG